MPKARPGQRKWNRILKALIKDIQAQIKNTSQLRAHLAQLTPSDESVNGEMFSYLFQAFAYLDESHEISAAIQEKLLQLWDIVGDEEETLTNE